MNNRNLLLIFLALLIIYGLSRLVSGNRTGNFRTELIAIDTTSVSSIVINPKDDSVEITLERGPEGWIATDGERSVKAVPSAVSTLLANLVLIRTQRVAANSPDKWAEYEVEEGKATRVRVYDGKKLLEDFIVGRFSFNPQTQSGVSFLRLSDEEEVYAVDGFQVLSFGQDFNAYRNRTLLRMNADMEVEELSYQLPDTSYRISRVNGRWMLNGTAPVDSAAVEQYLNVLRNLSGEQFADDVDELQLDQLEQRRVTLKGKNIPTPLVISIFRDSLRPQPFIIRSSQFPESLFASDSTGLYQQVYQPVDSLR